MSVILALAGLGGDMVAIAIGVAVFAVLFAILAAVERI